MPNNSTFQQAVTYAHKSINSIPHMGAMPKSTLEAQQRAIKTTSPIKAQPHHISTHYKHIFHLFQYLKHANITANTEIKRTQVVEDMRKWRRRQQVGG